VPFCIALGLTGHAVVSTDYVDAKMRDEKVMQIVPVVQLEAVDGQPPHSAHLDVELEDGTKLHGDTDIVIGHPDNPMSWDDLKVKFDGLTVPVLGAAKAGELFAIAREFAPGAVGRISALLAA
jgi:2-methylcitrate dehydratase PrpD